MLEVGFPNKSSFFCYKSDFPTSLPHLPPLRRCLVRPFWLSLRRGRTLTLSLIIEKRARKGKTIKVALLVTAPRKRRYRTVVKLC